MVIMSMADYYKIYICKIYPQLPRIINKCACLSGVKQNLLIMTWNLWGTGWKGKKTRTDFVLHGTASPEELPGVLRGSFGVVWDGASTATGQGAYGAYMLLNAPHKLSLYLAAGMPVVVWSGSAQADWVRRTGTGLVLDRLTDLPQVISALTEDTYQAMVQAACREGAALREGRRLLRALEEIES